MSFEIETKLIMTGKDPAGIRKSLAGLRGCGPFVFMNRKDRELKDTYYDTVRHSLSGMGIALRIRELGTGAPSRITIKRNERIGSGGAAVREELELDVTGENERTILEALSELLLPAGSPHLMPDAPGQSLKEMGLEILQKRRTKRTVLSILTSLEPGKTIGELALDEVAYRIGQGTVLHYELEVEAAGEEYQPLVEELTGLLRQAFPDGLRRWDHNKLITGFALERLHASGGLPILEDTTVCLDPVIYDAMETLLKDFT